MKRALQIGLSLPAYIGVSLWLLMAADHFWHVLPSSEAPVWVAASIAILYIGTFSWGLAPLTCAVAVIWLVVDYRKGRLPRSERFLPLFVIAAPVVWFLSLPLFAAALQW